MAATRSQSLLKEAMMNETKEFLESRLENLKETIDDPNAKIGERIHALLLLLRSGNREEENLHVHAYSASSQLPESPDFNRPEPKPNYVIKATSDVTEASSPLPNHTIKRHQRISLEEIDERRLKGLCLFCEESETPDHYLCHKNLGILMIDCDEDQSCDDEELVETEVATELNGIEDLAVENEANAKVISAIVKEESITQFQVPVSSLEPSLRINNASPTDCEDSQCVVGFDGLFGHEEAMLQVSDVQARAVVLKKSEGVTNNQVARQLFDKMPSKEKRIKHLKGWRFKFKRKNLTGIMLQIEQYKLMERRRRRYKKFSTNIKDESMRVLITWNHRRMVRQLHISRVQCKIRMMNDSWNMRRLTLKVMKSHRKHKWKSKKLQIASNFWINHPQELVELVLRTALTEHDTSLPLVDSRTKNLAPFVMQYMEVQEMVSMQDNETITKTYSGQQNELHDTTGVTSTKQELSYWAVANHVKRDAHVSFGSKCLAYNGCVIMEMNFAGFERGKTELLATSQKMQKMDSCKKQILVGIHTEIEENLKFKQLLAAVERFSREVIEELAKRIVIEQKIEGGLICGEVRFQVKHKWRFKLLHLVSEMKFSLESVACVSLSDDQCNHCVVVRTRCVGTTQMQFGSESNHVWHRWKARCFCVGVISTMRTWLSKGGGFDTVKRSRKNRTRGGWRLEEGSTAQITWSLRLKKRFKSKRCSLLLHYAKTRLGPAYTRV